MKNNNKIYFGKEGSDSPISKIYLTFGSQENECQAPPKNIYQDYDNPYKVCD